MATSASSTSLNAANSAPASSTSATSTKGVGLPTLFFAPGACSFGAMVALEWSGLPYRLIRHEGRQGPPFHPNYDKATPIMKQTPLLIRADGTPLPESSAILEHIAKNAPAKRLWISSDETENADEFNWILAFLHTSFVHSFHAAWVAQYRTTPGDEFWTLLRSISLREGTKALAQINKLLETREWIVGGRKTIADAYFVGVIRWNNTLKLYEDLPTQYPLVYKHYLKLEQDPAVKFAHAVEDQVELLSTGQFQGLLAVEDLDI